MKKGCLVAEAPLFFAVAKVRLTRPIRGALHCFAATFDVTASAFNGVAARSKRAHPDQQREDKLLKHENLLTQ